MISLKQWCEQNGEFGQQLMQEFVGELEDGTPITMSEISYGSSKKKVKWKCNKCTNEWYTSPRNRTSSKNGCILCNSNNIVRKNINDLKTWCDKNGEKGKQLLEEFANELRDGTTIAIDEIAYGSTREVKWRCKEGHEWYKQVITRTIRTSNCIECRKKLARVNKITPIEGENDLLTWCLNHSEFEQQLIKEWQNKLEDGTVVEINKISYGSSQNAIWRCIRCNKEFTQQIRSRTSQTQGCPNCNSRGTSYPEQFIYHALKQIFPETEHRYKALKNKYTYGIEFDIAIPIKIDNYKAICIEYSGEKWHKNKEEIDNLKRRYADNIILDSLK